MREFCPQELEDKMVADNPNIPIILGDFTNWQPKPMLTMETYCEALYA
jgi:hypothetical protein